MTRKDIEVEIYVLRSSIHDLERKAKAAKCYKRIAKYVKKANHKKERIQKLEQLLTKTTE